MRDKYLRSCSIDDTYDTFITGLTQIDTWVSLQTSVLPVPVTFELAGAAFRLNMTLSNGEIAQVRLWTSFDYNQGLVPVEVYSPSLQCTFSYGCTSGSCLEDLGTSLCGQYTVLEPPPSANCTGSFTCPKSYPQCTIQCESRNVGATCSAALCTAASCTPTLANRCSCDISGASRITTTSSLSAMMIVIIAAVVSWFRL